MNSTSPANHAGLAVLKPAQPREQPKNGGTADTANMTAKIDSPEHTKDAGAEREILVTVYIYDHCFFVSTHMEAGVIMRKLNCSVFSASELIRRFFTISTDAYASHSECVDLFIASLKLSGVSIGKYEWSMLPAKQ